MDRGTNSSKNGKASNVYLDRDHVAILEAIAKAKGETRTGVEPSRSQLIRKAVQNFIEDCREDPILKIAIETVEEQLRAEKGRSRADGRKTASGLQVMAQSS